MTTSTDELLPAYQGLLRAQSAALRGPEAAAPLSVDDALTSGSALRGKVVVVTGAASGFGKAYAIQVAKFGCVRPLSLLEVAGEVGKFADRLEPCTCSAKVVLSDMRIEGVQAVVDEITAAGGCVAVSPRSPLSTLTSLSLPQTSHLHRLRRHQLGCTSRHVRASSRSLSSRSRRPGLGLSSSATVATRSGTSTSSPSTPALASPTRHASWTCARAQTASRP